MDLPAAISPPTAKADIGLSVEDDSIALSPIATQYTSSRLSVLKCPEDLGIAPDAPTADSRGHRTLSCDMHASTPETKPQTLRSRQYIQFVTVCWFIYLEGWNDGTNGPLLPRIQRVYGVCPFPPVGGCC